ncbi:MAG: cation:proton antiporter, partial [Phycisphaerales bacterium]
PRASEYLFPTDIVRFIGLIAQLGLALYMFCVGMEFRTGVFASHRRQGVAVSLAGAVVPFVLASIAAVSIHSQPGLFQPGIGLWHAVFFIAAALSITAFPMLARIIRENNLATTPMGTVALAAGALDDVLAWCFLSIVIASIKSDWRIAAVTIGASIVFAVIMLSVVRPALRVIASPVLAGRPLSQGWLTSVLIALAVACFITDSIGIYAIFVAFLMGVVMPRGGFAEKVVERIEPLTVALLLPMFFVYSGMNTALSWLDSGGAIWTMLLLLIAACLGKGFGCAVAAKLTGRGTRDALCIGSLMNARGLMELIVINIALEQQIITPRLFAILVVVAIATTLMATPLFRLFRPREPRELRVAAVS